MPRPIGFSTGALAKGDLRRGVEIQSLLDADAIELSALREHELPHLVETISTLDLSRYRYISVHVPSRLIEKSETEVVDLLRRIDGTPPLITHPDVIKTPRLWAVFGSQLCIENMDQRKPVGRTAEELAIVFDGLPDASFCLDIGHARQIDPTLGVATKLLDVFRSRLRQVHLSQLGPNSEHLGMNGGFRSAVAPLITLIPPDTPVIIESVVEESRLKSQIQFARDLFSIEVVA